MSNITVNYSVLGVPSGNVSVDETTVNYIGPAGGNTILTANCYSVNEALLYLLNEQVSGNIVIPPGANFQVTLTP
jgi:hypothetical protein